MVKRIIVYNCTFFKKTNSNRSFHVSEYSHQQDLLYWPLRTGLFLFWRVTVFLLHVLYTTAIISITTVVQYIHKYKIQVDSVVSDSNGLSISWLRSMATRGEIHNSYYADPTPNVQHISWCLRSLSVEICKTWPHASTAEDPALCLNGPISTDSFQNPQTLRTISFGHDVIHTPAPFSVWGFIMTMVIVIPFARERKTVPNDFTPELKRLE